MLVGSACCIKFEPVWAQNLVPEVGLEPRSAPSVWTVVCHFRASLCGDGVDQLDKCWWVLPAVSNLSPYGPRIWCRRSDSNPGPRPAFGPWCVISGRACVVMVLISWTNVGGFCLLYQI